MVLAGVQERLQPLTAQLFPRRVWLALEDDAVTVMTVKGAGLAGSGPMAGGRAMTVELVRRVPLPRGACAEGKPLEIMALGDLIGDLLVELGLVGAEVMAVLPPEACTWRVVQWPFDDWPESPEEALRQIDPGLALPYDLSQAYLSLMPLPAAGAGLEACSSLMVSVSRQCVLRWIEVFDIAGVALERLEAAQVCELRALAPRLEGADAGLLEVLVVPERRGARITLLRHGVPEYGRRVLGSSAELESELERCLTYWRSRDRGVTGVRLWLSGSTPDLPMLADTLRQSGHEPVEILDPVEQGWFTLAPNASEEDPPPPGWALGRLFGLMQGEVAR